MNNNWYLVRLVFKIVCGEGHHRPQYDEQLRMIMANDESHALIRAKAIATSEAIPFLNNAGSVVQWHWKGILEVTPVTHDYDGAELVSTIREPADENSYLQFLQQKSIDTQLHS